MGHIPHISDLDSTPERQRYVNPALLIEMPPGAQRALDNDPMFQIRMWAVRYERLFAAMRKAVEGDTEGMPY